MVTGSRRILIALMSAALILTASAACLESPPQSLNKPPVARIGSPVENGSYETGQEVVFDGSGSYDPEKKPLTFKWDFGDNTTASGNLTRHAYALPGKYVVTLEVSDGKKRGIDRVTIHVAQANRPPVVSFRTSTSTASNEEEVEFNATETRDPDGDAMVFRWDFGDNSKAEGAVVRHIFTKVGIYNVTLTVSDGKTQASGVAAIIVYQANRPPMPVLTVSAPAAFLGEELEFNASASTDEDGDTLSVHWDFGDGSSAEGMVVRHAFSSPGEFNVTATVSDGKLSRNGTLSVAALPRASILIDWNQSDYGYIVRLEAPVDSTNLSFTVVDDSGERDASPNVTPISATEYRVRPSVAPVVGRTLTITVLYLDRPVGSRVLHIYENSPFPGRDLTAEYTVELRYRTTGEMNEECLNLTSRAEVQVRGPSAKYRVLIVNGTQWTREVDEEGNVMLGESVIVGWMDRSLFWGTELNSSMEMAGSGNMSSWNSTGVERARLYGESVMRTVNDNRTYIYQSMRGNQGFFNLTCTVETLGIEDHANGNGRIYRCIKTRTNVSGDGFLDTGFGVVHLMVFNETIAWQVCEERYSNTTIYIQFEQNMYLVNDTSGEWTWLDDESVSGERYEDSNGDGVYNPDPAPLDLDEAFTFHGPMPRELAVGDRIVGVNKYGVRLQLEVTEEGVRVVEGSECGVVKIVTVYSSASGNATGTATSWVVSEGNLTGLVVESLERKSWMGEIATETNEMTMRLERVRED
ncbi:MAG: PKD domain-containing protein [Thermoplasmata archaeon]